MCLPPLLVPPKGESRDTLSTLDSHLGEPSDPVVPHDHDPVLAHRLHQRSLRVFWQKRCQLCPPAPKREPLAYSILGDTPEPKQPASVPRVALSGADLAPRPASVPQGLGCSHPVILSGTSGIRGMRGAFSSSHPGYGARLEK